MRIRWYGQSAFLITGERAAIFIDPFGDVEVLAERGLQFDDSRRAGTAASAADGQTLQA